MTLIKKIKQGILKLYPEYDKVYGPYIRPDKRKQLFLRNITTQKGYTISWPKAKMEVKLKRKLKKNETTDHKDGDVTNNKYSNLQILTRQENARKDALCRDLIKVKCIWCNEEFILTKNQVNERAKLNSGPFCSKQCIGKYGASVQNGGKILKRKKVKVTYFKLNPYLKVK